MNAKNAKQIGAIIKNAPFFEVMVKELADYMQQNCIETHPYVHIDQSCEDWIFDKKAWILDILPDYEFDEED